MADLLLELFSEEIPARMQVEASAHLQKALWNELQSLLPPSGQFKSFITPRRLAVWITGLPISQTASESEIKGPKVGAPEAAIQGFLKKNNLAQGDLTERDGVYFAVVRKAGQQTADVLKATIEKILASFPWPKSMRWGNNDLTWVRPLHSILCIFDEEVVPVKFGPVTAGNATYGHRFLSPEKITISSAQQYEEKLAKAHVIADWQMRRAEILKQAEKAAIAKGLTIKKDEHLLDEVTGFVEWPVVLLGTIDAKYMDLPPEVLISEMRGHQKYFALEKDGKLSDQFLITANMQTVDGGKAIIAGNERVLRARLADGRFFWDQDRKKTLDAWAEGLKSVTFHAKLGSIADKVTRIKALAVALAEHVNGADKALVERAAALCKADLVTGMVGEFPELQGVMGRYYALHQKENAAVADAIRDHYKPLGPSDAVPTAPVSVCIALADKLDTLVSMFAIGEKPTGSKDPFALRRAALGVIRIILENKLRMNLEKLILGYIYDVVYENKLHNELYVEYKTKIETIKFNQSELPSRVDFIYSQIQQGPALESLIKPGSELIAFIIDRLKVQLKDSGIRHDVISAVVADGDDDLVRIVERAKALQNFLADDDGANLLAAYKRAANILTIEEKKDQKKYDQLPKIEAFTMQEEKMLHQALAHTIASVQELLKSEQFTHAMSALSKLRQPVDTFFDKVLVNDKDAQARANRLCLLAQFRSALDKIANFALVEG